MNLFCPTCDAAFTGATNCPRCGGRLITPAEAFALPLGAMPEPPDLIRPTAAIRVLVGTVAGLGVFFAGRDLVSAGAAPGESVSDWWATPVGLGVGVALRVVAATVGGLLAGAGRPNGAVTGLIAGLILAGLFRAVLGNVESTTKGMEAVAFAAVVVVAAATGMVGAYRWQPAGDPPRIGRRSTHGSSLERFAEQQSKVRQATSPPTRWFRVLLAASLAVAGVTLADEFREELSTLTGRAGRLGNPGSAGVIDLGIATAFLLAAGVFAGAGSAAGGRHGLLAGIVAAVGVVVFVPRRGEAALQPITTLLENLDFPTDLGATDSLLAVAATVAGTLCAAGWIGSQLLPPLAPEALRKRLTPIS
jgi:hypothetical protein